MVNKKRVAVIDADSIIWAIAYKYSEYSVEDREQVESMYLMIRTGIAEIVEKVNASSYIGFVAGPQRTKKYEIAKHRPYKGNRPEKPEWFRTWGKLCQDYMVEKLKFVTTTEEVEVDDYVIATAQILDLDIADHTPIICSTDKDLKIYPGAFLNIFKGEYSEISEEEAEFNFWHLVAMGDSSDNFLGCPKLGKDGATKLILEARASGLDIAEAIKQKFIAYYFSEYYGSLIFQETVDLVSPLPVNIDLQFVKNNIHTLEI